MLKFITENQDSALIIKFAYQAMKKYVEPELFFESED